MAFIYFLLIILLFFFKTNKVLMKISYFLLLILFCFNMDNADRGIYEWRLEQYEQTVGITEPGYYALMAIFTKLNLNIQALYIGVGLVYLSSLFYIVNKMSSKPNLVLAFYMLGIFLLDVTQLRATTSLVFVLWGFYNLYRIKETKRACMVFLLLIIVSALFHTSSLAYSLFIFSKITKKRLLLTLVSCLFSGLLFFKFVIIKYFGGLLDISTKIQNIAESDVYKGNNVNLITILLLLLLQCIYFSLIKLYGKNDVKIVISNNMCILLFLLIPLISFSADFRRIYYFISIFLIITLSNLVNVGDKKNICLCVFCLAFIYFFRVIYVGNYNTVLVPILTQNLLF